MSTPCPTIGHGRRWSVAAALDSGWTRCSPRARSRATSSCSRRRNESGGGSGAPIGSRRWPRTRASAGEPTQVGRAGSRREWTARRERPAPARSDINGRVANMLPGDVKSSAGTYRLRFDTGAYFAALGISPFHPFVEIVFEIGDAEQYHVPLLVSPFGYTTYRGS